MTAFGLAPRIAHLKKLVLSPNPPPEIIQAAKSILNQYPTYRHWAIPDWVEILARGTPTFFADVIDTARSDLHEHDP